MQSTSIEELEWESSLTEHDLAYYDFHRKRYQVLIKTLKDLHTLRSFERILDIGASFQTRLFDREFAGVQIDTLGFTLEKFKPVNNKTIDISFDLRDAGKPKQHQGDLKKYFSTYDVIVLAEVIEHLTIKPEKVLTLLHHLLKPQGIIVLQTPNAVFVGNRIKMLLGRNPFSWIRDDVKNPGHYREYTLQEIKSCLHRCDYRVIEGSVHNYFSPPSPWKRTALTLTDFLPMTFRNGITIVARKT